MRWNAATGAIARCKAMSIAYARKGRLAHAWRWTCGVKPTPKAVNKPSPHFIVHGLDKPGGFTTVSTFLGQRGSVRPRNPIRAYQFIVAQGSYLHDQNERVYFTPDIRGVSTSQHMSKSI